LQSKTLVIYNLLAGKGSAAKLSDASTAELDRAGLPYDLVFTRYPGHATELAQQAASDGCPLVVAAGGDGTVNEVVNGLMAARKNGAPPATLGVLPVGRGNDFAFGAGIPKELPEAVDTLIHGQKRQIDLGYFHGGDFPQGRYFANGIGLGFDTVVGFEAEKIKFLRGAASYLAALVKTIFLYAHAPVYELTMDGETMRQPFLLVSVMNGKRMGGAFYMAPDSDSTDAFFDLCLAGNVSQLRILPLAVKFFSGTQAQSPLIRMARARQISVKAIEGTIPAHADGETICTAGTELQIEIIPLAISVMTSLNGVTR